MIFRIIQKSKVTFELNNPKLKDNFQIV